MKRNTSYSTNSTTYRLDVYSFTTNAQNSAYHLTEHPIVVHWDMDVAILQPLDDLYDAMLYPSTHPRNIAARTNRTTASRETLAGESRRLFDEGYHECQTLGKGDGSSGGIFGGKT